jgi:hypothetical protein
MSWCSLCTKKQQTLFVNSKLGKCYIQINGKYFIADQYPRGIRKNNNPKWMVFRSFIVFVLFCSITFLIQTYAFNNPWFLKQGWKKSSRHPGDFHKRDDEDEKSENVFEAKFGSGEIMSSWETDDRRGDYLLYLHLLASTFLARALSFRFAFDLTTSLGMKKNYSNCLDPFESSICHKVSFYAWNNRLQKNI